MSIRQLKRSFVPALLCINAWAADPATFDIAAVLSFSGAYGITGTDMRRGVELAIEHRGGNVLGKPVRVSWEDDETKAQVAVQKATRLVGDGAQMIFGAVASGSTLALQTLADQRKVPLLVTVSADDRITRKDGSRYTFRTSNNIGMEVRMTAEYTREAKLKRVYGVVVDVGVGRDAWDSYLKQVGSAGVQSAGVDFLQIGTRDYAVAVDKIAKSDADGVNVLLFGNDAVTFLKQAAQVGLGKSKTLFGGSALLDETTAAAVGPGAVGVHSLVRYHFSVDNPANRKFVEAYRAKYNEWPSAHAGEAYDGMSWWLDVVDSTKSWDREKWVTAFEKSTRENSLEGRKTMRSCDHQASQPGLWGTVVEGKAPLPGLTVKVNKTFPADRLFDPC
ncbi:MAG: ABC transporter substrate-binding protein [Rubrivivax sp.]|nr:ABC transporter substrate-binding protein [Rubrivivax sp.]